MGIIETIKMLTREEGVEKGVQQKSLEVVQKLLAANKFTDSEIANFASVSVDFVKKVKKEGGS
jgi:hypothetical protein